MSYPSEIDTKYILWKQIKRESFDLDYAVINKDIANKIFKELEDIMRYFTGGLAKVKVFGKIYPLPRQQVTYGNSGITYKYSGTTVPALPWHRVLRLKDFLYKLKEIDYDFVVVNRYRNDNDHMGEHRDSEPELDPNVPIASLSFGQEGPFIFKHKDARNRYR